LRRPHSEAAFVVLEAAAFRSVRPYIAIKV